MNIYLNSFSNYAIPFFEQSIEPSLNAQDKKILAIAMIALGAVLALVGFGMAYVIGRYCEREHPETFNQDKGAKLNGQDELINEEWEPSKEAENLAKEWNDLEIFKNRIIWYRNSDPVLRNIGKALEVYAKTEDLNQDIEDVNSANGQGSSAQPSDLFHTFENALDSKVHGGFQETLQAAKQALDEKKVSQQEEIRIKKLLEVAKKVSKFIENVLKNNSC